MTSIKTIFKNPIFMGAIQSSRSNQVMPGNKLGCKTLSVYAKCPLSFYHSTLLYELDNNAQQSLFNVSQQPKGFAVQTAKGILQLYGYVFASPECSLPECCGTFARETSSTTWESQKNLSIDLKVFPNPAKDEVFFDLKFPDGSQNVVIQVRDIVERLVWSQQLYGGSQIIWPARNNAKGLYFYTVEIDGKPIKSGKISLIK